MTVDSVKPVLYRITIDASGLGGAAPDDGFVDPVTIEEYIAAINYVGTVTNPTVSADDSIQINGVYVTFPTGSTNLAGIISEINALTHHHHVIASNDTSKLKLESEVLFEGNEIGVIGEESVLQAIGYDNPTRNVPGTLPSTLGDSLGKERGNMRWEMIVEQLSLNNTPVFVGAVDRTGGTVDDDPTEIEFTVGYQLPHHNYIADESNPGETLHGIPALKRMVANALVQERTKLRPVFDPTNDSTGNDKGLRIVEVTAGAIASTLSAAEANITVEAITNVK